MTEIKKSLEPLVWIQREGGNWFLCVAKKGRMGSISVSQAVQIPCWLLTHTNKNCIAHNAILCLFDADNNAEVETGISELVMCGKPSSKYVIDHCQRVFIQYPSLTAAGKTTKTHTKHPIQEKRNTNIHEKLYFDKNMTKRNDLLKKKELLKKQYCASNMSD